MRIPKITAKNVQRTTADTFYGYDRRGDRREGVFFDMKNMSSKDFPAVSIRKKRGRIDLSGKDVYGIFTLDAYQNGRLIKNALVADCENRLSIIYEENGEIRVSDFFNTTTTLTPGEKTAVVSGPCVYFFPDKMYYNFTDGSVGPLEIHAQYDLGTGADGAFYDMILEPSTVDGEDADESSPYRRMRRRAFQTENGLPLSDTEISLSFSSGLKTGDTVVFRGFKNDELNKMMSIVNKPADGKFLVVESSVTQVQTEGTVYLSREVPDMDHVITSKNRLWGCRYGVGSDGKWINEIYASALGDPCNWHKFNGTASDSYSCSVGSGGAFTGAVNMDGYPVFFKEDTVIKVFGDYPGEYTVSESAVRGIENGSEKSAVFVHDSLYYKSHSGIVRYDGGVPVNIDAALGDEKYKNAVAGTVGDKYYISMENSENKRELFVYDTVRRIWHKEDCMNISSFARAGAELYFLAEEDGKKTLYTVSEKKGTRAEDEIDWMCETGSLGYNTPDSKYVSSVQLRLESTPEAAVSVYIEYDRSGVWQSVSSFGGRDGSVHLRIKPRRCDSFRLKIEGKGECSVISITKSLESCGPSRGPR